MLRSFVFMVAASLLAGGIAHAQPRSVTGSYSPYEERAIHDAEADLRTRVDPRPEGKKIERIDFIRLDPIDRRDPLPEALDAVHATSRVPVLKHELLVREGDVWTKAMVDESARNLRLVPQLSLVLCVPMLGSTPGTVRMIVITKDVWSLYVDFDFSVTPGGLELLDLEPKETNIAGLHHTALARFILQPASYSLGASYEVPRLDGRWLDLLLDGNVIVNRATGQLEGSYGSARITRPLYSSHARWAWTTAVTWTDQIDRRYVNAAVTTFTPTAGATPVPWIWRERTLSEQAKLTRSFGWETKNDFSVGGSISHAVYRAPADPSLDPVAIAEFQRAAVPVGENRVGPFVQWHGYTSNFVRILDFDTLGLQEDNRLGHELWIRVYPVLRALGSSRDLLGTYAAAAYTARMGDGLAARVRRDRAQSLAQLPQRAVLPRRRIAPPRLPQPLLRGQGHVRHEPRVPLAARRDCPADVRAGGVLRRRQCLRRLRSPRAEARGGRRCPDRLSSDRARGAARRRGVSGHRRRASAGRCARVLLRRLPPGALASGRRWLERAVTRRHAMPYSSSL
jgi:hypothetical protein